MYILGKNNSKYCSRIIVVHVHATVFFSKVHPACHNIVNGIKPGSDSRKTDKHDVDSSKAVCMKAFANILIKTDRKSILIWSLTFCY